MHSRLKFIYTVFLFHLTAYNATSSEVNHYIGPDIGFEFQENLPIPFAISRNSDFFGKINPSTTRKIFQYVGLGNLLRVCSRVNKSSNHVVKELTKPSLSPEELRIRKKRTRIMEKHGINWKKLTPT